MHSAWAIFGTLLYNRIMGIIIINIRKFVVMWMNDFTLPSVISNTYIPKNITTGTTLDFNKHFNLPFSALS